jgi:hypothetical protein
LCNEVVGSRRSTKIPRNFQESWPITAAMQEPTSAPDDNFYATLWIGALLLAGGAEIDAFPATLDELALEFFERFRPIAKA